MLHTIQWVAISGCLVLAVVGYLLFESVDRSLATMLCLGGGPLASLFIYLDLRARRARNIGVLRREITQAARTAGWKDQEFWEMVRGEFGGIPTPQRLVAYSRSKMPSSRRSKVDPPTRS